MANKGCDSSKHNAKGFAKTGLFAGHRNVRDVSIRGFFAHISLMASIERMGREAFDQQIGALKERLMAIHCETGMSILDCVDTLLEKFEEYGFRITDSVLSMAIAAGLEILEIEEISLNSHMSEE